MPARSRDPIAVPTAASHWEESQATRPWSAVWSILFHPHDPNVILGRRENCEIYLQR